MASTSFSLAPRALAQPHGDRSSGAAAARRAASARCDLLFFRRRRLSHLPFALSPTPFSLSLSLSRSTIFLAHPCFYSTSHYPFRSPGPRPASRGLRPRSGRLARSAGKERNGTEKRRRRRRLVFFVDGIPLSFAFRGSTLSFSIHLLISLTRAVLTSSRSALAKKKNPKKHTSDLSKLVVAQQGPAPPNPIVVERFQQVVSQLFTQRIVRLGGPVDDDMANLVVAQLLYLDASGKVRE